MRVSTPLRQGYVGQARIYGARLGQRARPTVKYACALYLSRALYIRAFARPRFALRREMRASFRTKEWRAGPKVLVLIMKPPRAYARGILHFFSEIRRSTLLRSSSFGGSAPRIDPRP